MTCDELTDPIELGPIPSGTPALWLELCVKYDVPEFGAPVLPLPTFDSQKIEGE